MYLGPVEDRGDEGWMEGMVRKEEGDGREGGGVDKGRREGRIETYQVCIVQCGVLQYRYTTQ